MREEINKGIRPNKEIHGFVVLRKVVLKDKIFYELKHLKTGARYIHIESDATESVFIVFLKTLPKDSTGVAHILEHSVLAGSEKYPVRDPFFSMIKRSLNSFMNAFTSSDWTGYPFATENRKDYYNLLSVYLDAVFFPKISELTFRQEGWKYEFDEDGKLQYGGVVYNEMKGSMSSVPRVMGESVKTLLMPRGDYSHNSGGDPSAIADLTHEQLKAFHELYYHPSNSYVYSYGDIPLVETLRFVNENYLNRFEEIDLDIDVPLEPKWCEQREHQVYYPVEEGELDNKHQVCVSWLTVPTTDSFEVLSLALLSNILINNLASPLYKALMDSGLGLDLCDGTGLQRDEANEVYFSCGLKGVKKENINNVCLLILSVLTKISTVGIDKELIDIALHQLELRQREMSSSYPYGLELGLRISSSWIHGGDPIDWLDFDKDIQKIKKGIARGSFFENLIKRHFISNKHCLFLVFSPDDKMGKVESQKVRAKLDAIQKSLSDEEESAIRKISDDLKELQESEEDLSCLPSLELSDIDLSEKPVKVIELDGTSLLSYEQNTNGLLYLKIVFDIQGLDESLIPLVPFFCYAISEAGTKNYNTDEMARLIGSCTGGISVSPMAFDRVDGQSRAMVMLGARCLSENQGRMLCAVKELLTNYNFSDLDYLAKLIKEFMSRCEPEIVSMGHQNAFGLAVRGFSKTFQLKYLWGDVYQLRFLKDLIDILSEKDALQKLSERLIEIGEGLIRQDNMKTVLIGEKEILEKAHASAIDLKRSIPDTLTIAQDSVFTVAKYNEGWSTSTAVSFVARAMQTVDISHPDAPALHILSKIIKGGFIHREIREKGGAYGGMVMYDYLSGAFVFVSYRDPHIVSTIDVFKKALAFACSGNFNEEDVKNAILMISSDMNKPGSPAQKAQNAFLKSLRGLSDDLVVNYKKKLLSLTLNQVREVAEKYFSEDSQGSYSVAVISNTDKIKEANEKLEQKLIPRKI